MKNNYHGKFLKLVLIAYITHSSCTSLYSKVVIGIE